jgi:hypothetical protein
MADLLGEAEGVMELHDLMLKSEHPGLEEPACLAKVREVLLALRAKGA